MSKLSTRLAEVAFEIMADGGALTPTRLSSIVKDRYPDLLDAAAEHLINGGLWRETKRIMREDEADEQNDLPGLGLPRVISLPGPDGTCLRLARFATWEDLAAADELRATNIERASARHTRFRVAMVRVRPYMEGHPEVRVCDVMARLGIEDPDGDSPSDGVQPEA